MSDAIRIEHRLHHLEQRLHQIVAGRGRNRRARSGENSPREMERRAVDRLFKEPRRSRPQPNGNGYDPGRAREVEREAMQHLYGDKPTIVIETSDEGGEQAS